MANNENGDELGELERRLRSAADQLWANRPLRRVGSMVAQIHPLRVKNSELRHTPDLPLPKLISGAFDVSKLEIKISELRP